MDGVSYYINSIYTLIIDMDYNTVSKIRVGMSTTTIIHLIQFKMRNYFKKKKKKKTFRYIRTHTEENRLKYLYTFYSPFLLIKASEAI